MLHYQKRDHRAKAFKTALVRESKTDVALSVASRDNDAASAPDPAGRPADERSGCNISGRPYVHDVYIELAIAPLIGLLQY